MIIDQVLGPWGPPTLRMCWGSAAWKGC